MGLINKLNNISNMIDGLFGALVMIICIAGILILAILLIIKKVNKPVAVILQAIGSCALMMPVMWGLNNYVDSRVGGIEQRKVNINTILEQERKIAELQNTIRHIESTGFNLQQFEKILDLGLVETRLQQTILSKTIYDKTHRGWLPGSSFDWEYLGVSTHNITAKFGVDLKEVSFYNSDNGNNAIMVYGIKSKYLGTSNDSNNVEVSEVRRKMLDNNGTVTETRIDNSGTARTSLIEQERLMSQTYRTRLNQGLQTEFMDETVEKLAEYFIKMILAPLNREVIFTNNAGYGSNSLEDFLRLELDEKNRELQAIISQ